MFAAWERAGKFDLVWVDVKGHNVSVESRMKEEHYADK